MGPGGDLGGGERDSVCQLGRATYVVRILGGQRPSPRRFPLEQRLGPEVGAATTPSTLVLLPSWKK